MMIYAIFMCMGVNCRLAAPVYFQSKAECRKAILYNYGSPDLYLHNKLGRLDSEGRLLMAHGDPPLYAECLGRKVETWKP